jgi:hypothetical protein
MSKVVDEQPILGDLKGGEIVRLDAGLVRVGPMVIGGERWCRLLREDLSETSDILWPKVCSRVLEVLQDQGAYAGARKGESVDPMRMPRRDRLS